MATAAPIAPDPSPSEDGKGGIEDGKGGIGEAPARPQERREAGRELRSAVPRSSHAEWSARPDRPDPVSLLEGQAPNRIPDLVPIRYGRMLGSPFTFLRGAAIVMASDLAETPASGLEVQLCGDAHLTNFGLFATPERRLVFDLNDFDETHPGPFEWDLKRLAASIVVAARDRGFVDAAQAFAARAAARSYRTRMREFAEMGFLDVWYARIDADEALEAARGHRSRKAVKRTEKAIEKARANTNLGALARFAERIDGAWRIKLEPPLIVAYPEMERSAEALGRSLAQYGASLQAHQRELLSRYRFVDFARKVVGVGSVGTETFMLLLMGDRDDDPLFLQLKEADRSVLEPFTARSGFRHQGERVVTGQRLTQAATDSFLGWLEGPSGRDFYVRQLRDMKGSANIETMLPPHLSAYAELCGSALARAHARTGDAAAIAGYLGRGSAFDQAIERFAIAYADQTERDYDALVVASESGRIEAEEGV